MLSENLANKIASLIPTPDLYFEFLNKYIETVVNAFKEILTSYFELLTGTVDNYFNLLEGVLSSPGKEIVRQTGELVDQLTKLAGENQDYVKTIESLRKRIESDRYNAGQIGVVLNSWVEYYGSATKNAKSSVERNRYATGHQAAVRCRSDVEPYRDAIVSRET